MYLITGQYKGLTRFVGSKEIYSLILRNFILILEFTILLKSLSSIFIWIIPPLLLLAASIAFVCIFSAYILASPSVVSLFEYSLIIMSMIPGYFLFNEIPSNRTFLGVAFIIGAGIYIYFREKVRDQYIATDTPVRRWKKIIFPQLI